MLTCPGHKNQLGPDSWRNEKGVSKHANPETATRELKRRGFARAHPGARDPSARLTVRYD